MDQSTVAFLKAIIAFLVVAGTGMTGFWLWVRARSRPLPDLEEQVDFTEHRLVQERRAAELPTARIPTPV